MAEGLFGSLIPQIQVFVILASALFLFIQNRIRYDIIALLVMLAIIAAGLLDYQAVFANLGHPVIIIVASMFVISQALVSSGIVDAIVGRLSFLQKHPILGLGCLVILVAILSAFVNNAGALAMVIPIALHLARKTNTPISLYLLPMAFASHLGGFMTLIGTPRNIIISDFRESATGVPFAMFDFLPVGGLIAIFGCLFLVSISWRFLPLHQKNVSTTALLRAYTTEVVIDPPSSVGKMTIKKFLSSCKQTITLLSVYRDEKKLEPTPTLGLLPGDRLVIQGEIDNLKYYSSHYHLSLTGLRAHEQFVTNADDYLTIEAVVPPYSKVVGTVWDAVPLKNRFGTNFIGMFRRNTELTSEIAHTRFWPNDILLLHGRTESVNETIAALQLLPIAHSEGQFGRASTIFVTLGIVLTTIVLATLNFIPVAIVFLAACLTLVLTNLISLREAYESIDQTVLILLAGMITLGEAMQASGAAASIATSLLAFDSFLGAAAMLILILLTTMFLSDFMNTTASAVIMAPIAILVGQSLHVSIDPFLIAVAIGASCAFLTPIGHESNTIVMKQGGYNFKDYFRVGFPLELIILCVSIPAILYFWPF